MSDASKIDVTKLSTKDIPEEMLEILTRTTLFKDITLLEFDKTIVQEEETRQTIFLICLGGILVENAEPTSTNLMVNDDSGAGKDYIVKSVLNFLPKENVVRIKRISPKVFTYWHNAKFEPDWTWDGKVFYNEDISNSVLNCSVFKVMASSDGINKSQIMINQTSFEIITKGKPAMIITIALANPKPELLRRFPICNLDTTEKQTKAILEKKAIFHKKGIKPSYDKSLMESLTFLKRVKIKVPFADKLVKVLSTKNIIIRTHFDRLIDYIKFSCAIHQYQRDIDETGYLLANEEDYNIGRIALIKTTSNIFSIPLTRNQKKILDILKELPDVWYSVSDIEPKVTFCSDRTLRKELDNLTEFGFLEKDKEDRESSRKPVMVYRYLELYKINIPLWKDIQNISNASHQTTTSINSTASNDTTNETIETKEEEIQG